MRKQTGTATGGIMMTHGGIQSPRGHTAGRTPGGGWQGGQGRAREGGAGRGGAGLATGHAEHHDAELLVRHPAILPKAVLAEQRVHLWQQRVGRAPQIANGFEAAHRLRAAQIDWSHFFWPETPEPAHCSSCCLEPLLYSSDHKQTRGGTCASSHCTPKFSIRLKWNLKSRMSSQPRPARSSSLNFLPGGTGANTVASVEA